MCWLSRATDQAGEDKTMFSTISLWLYRISFVMAALLIILAIWERILRNFGYTLSFLNLEPGRMMDLAVVFLLLVCAFLLRRIGEQVKK